MLTTPTGSNPNLNDIIVGTLSFMESGVVNIFKSEDKNIDPVVASTFQMTTDFIFYALMRSDWMIEFAQKYDLVEKESTPNDKPTLTLIEGGKEE